MPIFPTILLTAGVALAAGAVFMLCRNQWVYRAQMAFHREAFDRPAMQWVALGRPGPDDLCEDYDTMLWRFWVWDREAFRIRRLPAPAEQAA
jgi:hypothetical protein